jgi:hypothetical protein
MQRLGSHAVTPIEAFKAIRDRNVVGLIVIETNRNARQRKKKKTMCLCQRRGNVEVFCYDDFQGSVQVS